VVVNPFIWSRLAQQGKNIPFFFEEFKTNTNAIEASSIDKNARYKLQPTSISHILETLVEISQRLLGHTVSHLMI
jgi:hypothetical protein